MHRTVFTMKMRDQSESQVDTACWDVEEMKGDQKNSSISNKQTNTKGQKDQMSPLK